MSRQPVAIDGSDHRQLQEGRLLRAGSSARPGRLARSARSSQLACGARLSQQLACSHHLGQLACRARLDWLAYSARGQLACSTLVGQFTCSARLGQLACSVRVGQLSCRNSDTRLRPCSACLAQLRSSTHSSSTRSTQLRFPDRNASCARLDWLACSACSTHLGWLTRGTQLACSARLGWLACSARLSWLAYSARGQLACSTRRPCHLRGGVHGARGGSSDLRSVQTDYLLHARRGDNTFCYTSPGWLVCGALRRRARRCAFGLLARRSRASGARPG